MWLQLGRAARRRRWQGSMPWSCRSSRGWRQSIHARSHRSLVIRCAEGGQGDETDSRLIERDRSHRFGEGTIAVVSLRGNDRANVLGDNFGWRQLGKIDIVRQ